jgi:hypothetical protein
MAAHIKVSTYMKNDDTYLEIVNEQDKKLSHVNNEIESIKQQLASVE